MSDYIRHGSGCVRPYLYGPLSLPDFLSGVFDAEELERHAYGPKSFHVEMRIGDSFIAIETGELPPGAAPWTNSIYVYVPDADATYEKAMQHGADSVAAPADKHYEERQGGFRDVAGNTWWVSTFTPKQQRARTV